MTRLRFVARVGLLLLALTTLSACCANLCYWWEPCGADCAPCGDPCDLCDTRR